MVHHMGVELRDAGETVDLVILDYYPTERDRRTLTLAEMLTGLGIEIPGDGGRDAVLRGRRRCGRSGRRARHGTHCP